MNPWALPLVFFSILLGGVLTIILFRSKPEIARQLLGETNQNNPLALSNIPGGTDRLLVRSLPTIPDGWPQGSLRSDPEMPLPSQAPPQTPAQTPVQAPSPQNIGQTTN